MYKSLPIRSFEELCDWRQRLNILQSNIPNRGNVSIQHLGTPTTYPCIAISKWVKTRSGIPQFIHEYVYMEDLITLMPTKNYLELFDVANEAEGSLELEYDLP